MSHHWALTRLRHSSRPFLQNLDDAFWTQHVRYMLGEEVRGLVAKSSSGAVLATTSWHTFIVYDQELRNLAFKNVNEQGMTIRDAMLAARRDNELRTKYLVTPLATAHLGTPPQQGGGGRKRGGADWDDGAASWEQSGKGKQPKKQKAGGKKGEKKGDKAGGKAKAKSKGKGPKTKLQMLRNAGKLEVRQ